MVVAFCCEKAKPCTGWKKVRCCCTSARSSASPLMDEAQQAYQYF